MWLPLIAYLLVNIKYISSLLPSAPNEPAELTDLFIESLKVDPLLLGKKILYVAFSLS